MSPSVAPDCWVDAGGVAHAGSRSRRPSLRALVVCGLMAGALVSCSDSGGSKGATTPPTSAASISDAAAYRLCRSAILEVEDGLDPMVRDSVEWPDLGSDS